ncbi:MAG: hypothetical protein HQL79_12410 [Magnetococcales bacterium]|nr:hypothetical protein [Magnetococcales bacterium]
MDIKRIIYMILAAIFLIIFVFCLFIDWLIYNKENTLQPVVQQKQITSLSGVATDGGDNNNKIFARGFYDVPAGNASLAQVISGNHISVVNNFPRPESEPTWLETLLQIPKHIAPLASILSAFFAFIAWKRAKASQPQVSLRNPNKLQNLFNAWSLKDHHRTFLYRINHEDMANRVQDSLIDVLKRKNRQPIIILMRGSEKHSSKCFIERLDTVEFKTITINYPEMINETIHIDVSPCTKGLLAYDSFRISIKKLLDEWHSTASLPYDIEKGVIMCRKILNKGGVRSSIAFHFKYPDGYGNENVKLIKILISFWRKMALGALSYPLVIHFCLKQGNSTCWSQWMSNNLCAFFHQAHQTKSRYLFEGLEVLSFGHPEPLNRGHFDDWVNLLIEKIDEFKGAKNDVKKCSDLIWPSGTKYTMEQFFTNIGPRFIDMLSEKES